MPATRGYCVENAITQPVLYDHFASKNALFETLLRSISDGFLAQGGVIGQSFRR
jgi:hypothetical protein